MRDLAIEPHEAELVRKIFQMTVNEGYGSHQLAEYANNAGYRTHNGAEFQSNIIIKIGSRNSIRTENQAKYQKFLRHIKT